MIIGITINGFGCGASFLSGSIVIGIVVRWILRVRGWSCDVWVGLVGSCCCGGVSVGGCCGSASFLQTMILKTCLG